ncbi:hypothetical protein [Bradyrhizobium sp. MOS003]|jgi:hypothetical protein|uniref:hypothetical protein n=1 Tax=Bradyrhizobium sp. MOS003 TaxID=2133946 RepID=UPI0018F40C99|nr:hypothetical protein [Bradyrhizobium sp. MOS003]
MTVWIYNKGKELMVFVSEEAAKVWLDEHDPQGVAFEYEVLDLPAQLGDRG